MTIKYLIGNIHGKTSYLMIENGNPHYPDVKKKKKHLFHGFWQRTVVCPDRLKTFKECEEISALEAIGEKCEN